MHKRLWPLSLGNFRSDGSAISTYGYLYDNVGNRTKVTEANLDYTDYVYDASYTLRTEERKNASGSRYTQVCHYYNQAEEKADVVLRQLHRAADSHWRLVG